MSEPVHVHPVPPAARGFQGRRAGVVTRTVAGAVDYLVVGVAVLGTYAGWGVLLFLFNPINYAWPRWPFAAFLGLFCGYLFCYLAIAWMATGRTVGGRLMGVRVLSFRGRRMRPAGAVLRSVLYVVFPLGLFWCVVNRANRSVQDILLRTSVVYDWSSHRPGDAASDGAVPRA